MMYLTLDVWTDTQKEKGSLFTLQKHKHIQKA